MAATSVRFANRESNGTTAFSFQDCSEIPAAKEPARQSVAPSPTFIDLSSIDLLPKHAGTVAYDVIANVNSPASPSLATIHFDFVVHDPTPPREASIVSPLLECNSSQLRVESPAPVSSEPKRFLRVYEATNISSRACSLAGLPRLNLNMHGALCPNCANDFVRIRPNGRIDLASGQSAHFLLGMAVHVKTWDEQNCTPAPSLTLVLDDNNKRLELPYGGCGGGALDVNTWREGKFDGDPLKFSMGENTSCIRGANRSDSRGLQQT